MIGHFTCYGVFYVFGLSFIMVLLGAFIKGADTNRKRAITKVVLLLLGICGYVYAGVLIAF